MPDRIVRIGILTSDPVNLLSWAAEVFYRRLFNVVDDYGRYDARPAILRSHLYPLKVDRVSDSDVGKWLTECVNAGLVSAYQVSGRPYLEVLKFGQRVRADKSKWPPPPSSADICQQPLSDAPVFVPVSVVVVVDDKPAIAAPTGRKTRLPKDFAISDAVRAWAADKGYGQLDEHLDAFRRKATAKGYTYIDWDSAFMEAIREDWAKLRGRGQNGAAPAAESRTTPLDPASLYKPEPALTPEQLAANKANAAAQLAKLKQGGLPAVRQGAH